MGQSSYHWIIVLVVVAGMIWSAGRIVGRLGFSRLWGALILVPGVNLLAMVYLAVARWPIDKGADS